MKTIPNTPEKRAGSIFLRILGAVFVVYAMLHVLGAVSLFADLGQPLAFFKPQGSATVFGLGPVQGVTSYVLFGLEVLGFAFAGVQLARLRRSGWIAGIVLLGYVVLSLFLYMGTRQVERQFLRVGKPHRDALFEGMEDPSASRAFQEDFLEQHAYAIQQAYRPVWFQIAIHASVLVYLISQWARFLEIQWRYSVFREVLKLGVMAVVITSSALWTFGGAESYDYHRALTAAKQPIPVVDKKAFNRLSPENQSRLVALLYRRLIKEKSPDVAATLKDLDITASVKHLAAEDIPGIIEAARATDPEVRAMAYELLNDVATPEARRTIVEALSDPHSVAVMLVRQMHPEQAPDWLIKRVKDAAVPNENDLNLLAYFRDGRVLPVLLKFAAGDNDVIRAAALPGLEQHPGEPAEKALIDALDDKELWIRGTAAYRLRWIGTKRAVPALIAVLKDPGADQYTRPRISNVGSLHDDARMALSGITGHDERDPRAWETWWAQHGPDFDLRRNLVGRLFTPVGVVPERPARSREELEQEPYKSYQEAIGKQFYAAMAISWRDMRDLAPELARFLQLPDDQADYKFMAAVAAEILADWGFREGIQWWIDRVEDQTLINNPNTTCRTLGRVTGVQFFMDAERWKSWWKENQHRFPSALDQAHPGKD